MANEPQNTDAVPAGWETCRRADRLLSWFGDPETHPMIKRQVRIRPLADPNAAREDAAFWRAQPPAARLAAIEILRRQVYGAPARLLRTARVLRLHDESAVAIDKDISDLEALGDIPPGAS
jgi:hypothetical protein